MSNHNSNNVQFDSLMKQMAQDHQPQLPDPGIIWWRAQILKKQADKERIERPLVFMRLAAATICVVVIMGFLIASWGQGQPANGAHVSFLTPLLVISALGCALLLGLLAWSPPSKT
jgi:hypothetical protein